MLFPLSTYSNSLLPFYIVTGVKAPMLEGYIITRVIAYGSLVAYACTPDSRALRKRNLISLPTYQGESALPL